MKGNIKIFSAPLQGYTDCVWRNAHAQLIGGIDVYCAPFIRIEHGSVRNRDVKDVLPINNGIPELLPQVLCGPASQTVELVESLTQMGYQSIDLNLGCPHPPIALHHKGCGLLKYPDEIGQIFEQLSKIKEINYSVKMRLGWDDNRQWEAILPLLDILQPRHLTVHARIGKQQYKGNVDLETFATLLSACKYPVVYNGDVTSYEDFADITEKFGNLNGIMVGRGLIANPCLFAPEKKKSLIDFHTYLFEAYKSQLDGGDHQLLNKMKSLWQLFLPLANNKARKAIKKSNTLTQYLAASQDAINSVIETD